MSKAKVIALAIALILLLAVVVQNSQTTTVSLLFIRVSMPLAFLLAIMVAGGFVCGLITALLIGRTHSGPGGK